MEPQSYQTLKKPHICEICLRHDPMVKDYSEDMELQTAIREYVHKETGDTVNMDDIAKMCDSCYFSVNEMTAKKE